MTASPQARKGPDRRPRRRRVGTAERLEARTLLSTLPSPDLASASPLSVPADVTSGFAAPAVPAFFAIRDATEVRLVATAHAIPSEPIRLSVLDATGQPLAQSDGLGLAGPDPRIDQHLPAGSAYLEVQSLGRPVAFSLTTLATPASPPYQTIPIDPSPGGLADGTAETSGDTKPPTAVADFNGDGLPDLAAIDGIHLALGDGTFGLPTTPLPIPTDQLAGLGPMIAARIDGREDLVYTTFRPSPGTVTIHLLIGHGDGTFEAGSSFDVAAPGPAETLVEGDFNGDGRPDLAFTSVDAQLATDGTDGFLDVLPGLAGGGFGASRSLDLGPVDPVSIAVGNFLGDGRDELAVGLVDETAQSSRVAVVSTRPDGSFSREASLDLGPVLLGHDLNADNRPANPGAGSVIAADFNGDGKPDLAVAGLTVPAGDPLAGSGEVDVFLNQGGGQFAAPGRVNLGDFVPDSLAAGDFTGTGRIDVAALGFVSVTSGGGYALRLLADTSSSAGPAFSVESPIASSFSGDGLVSADVNGDGKDDLIVSDGGQTFGTAFSGTASTLGSVDVAISRGDDTFRDASTVSDFPNYGTNIGDELAGDFNGDGRMDLAIDGYSPGSSPANPTSEIDVYLGKGDGTFNAPSVISVGTLAITSLISADVDGDGHLDLVVAGAFISADGTSSSAEIETFRGRGDGTFGGAEVHDLGPGLPFSLASGDFNGDGRADLAFVFAHPELDPSSGGTIDVLEGLGGGTFGAPTTLDPDAALPAASVASAFRTDVISLSVADVNGDRRADLVAGLDLEPGVGAVEENFVETFDGRADGGFAAPRVFDFGTAREIASIVPADVNGDGSVDLVALVDDPIAGFEVFLGRSDGSFDPPIFTDLTGDQPSSLVVADLDGDGHPDLLIDLGEDFQAGTAEFGAFLGRGDGSFGAPTVSETSIPIGTTAVADFNRDGRADFGAGSIDLVPSIAFGLGDGEFVNASDLAATVREDPVAADFSGDGVDDVLVIDDAGNIQWRKGRPSSPGSFDPPQIINPGVPSRDLAVVSTAAGLFLVSVDLDDNALTVFADRGGRFVRVRSIRTGLVPAQVIVGDVNDDGNEDLIVRNAGDGTATVFLGFGDGSFGQLEAVSIGVTAADIALARLDPGSPASLIVADRGGGQVRIFAGMADGEFGDPSPYPAGAGPYGLGVNDDGDTVVTSDEGTAGVASGTFAEGGNLDLAAIDPGTNSLAVLTGLGGGRLANPRPMPTSSPGVVVRAGDFDGDHVEDLAVLTTEGLLVSLSDRRGGFLPPELLPAGPMPNGLTLADVNGDGHLDLLVGDAFGDVLTLLGNGAGTFAPYQAADQQISVAVTGMAANGSPQFAIADKGGDLVAVQASPTASAQTLADSSQGLMAPGAVTAADLNGDGKPDLIVADSGANTIVVYLGLGSGEYMAGQTFPAGTSPVSVTVADLSGDGIPDLAVADQGSNDVATLLGQGQGASWTLMPGIRVHVGYGPAAIAVADVNGDGFPDLLVSDSESNDVRLLLGRGHGFFDDQHEQVFATGTSPGPVFVGHFSNGSAQLDLVTVNAGSNDLTFIPDINGGNTQGQGLPSGGLDPIAAVEETFAGGTTGLLVANNGDGRLSFFVGGDAGLEFVSTFEDASLPHPTSLTSDSLGDVFGGTEGVDAAIPIALGLDLASEGTTTGETTGESGGETVGTTAGPIEIGSVEAAANAPEPETADVQSSLLQPLAGSSLALVATLFVGTVEPSEGESIALETAAEGAAIEATSGQAALPNQGRPGNGGPDGPDDGEGQGEDDGSPETPAQGPAPPDPFVWFLAGLEEDLRQAGAEARAADRLPRAAIQALSALFSAWPFAADRGAPTEPEAERPPSPDAVEDSRPEDAPTIDAPAGLTDRPEAEGRPDLSIGAAAVGLVLLTRPLIDPRRPRIRRTVRRRSAEMAGRPGDRGDSRSTPGAGP